MRYYSMRERHIRSVVTALLAIAFLKMNWGSTFEGVNHIVLSIRGFSFARIDGELAEGIGYSLIAFGETVSNLLIIMTVWIIFNRVLIAYDVDAEHYEDEYMRLRKENASFLNDLTITNEKLYTLLQNLRLLEGKDIQLERHRDRVLELSVELDKLCQKKIIKPKSAKTLTVPAETDLFTPPKKPMPHKKRRAFHGKRDAAVPKF